MEPIWRIKNRIRAWEKENRRKKVVKIEFPQPDNERLKMMKELGH